MERKTINDVVYARFRDTDYWCTEEGEVYSFKRKKPKKMIPIKETIGGKSYYKVNLYAEGKRKKFMISRVVWESFNGPIPDSYFIGHINNANSMNDLYNLELVLKSKGITCRKKYRLIINNDTNEIYKGQRDAAKRLYISHTTVWRYCSDKVKNPSVNISWYHGEEKQ